MGFEKLAIAECNFYKNKDSYFREIADRKMELAAKFYVFPVSYPDEEAGVFRVSGRRVEDQVADKLEAEEALEHRRKRAIEQIQRFIAAYSSLDPGARQLVRLIYLEDCPYTTNKAAQKLGYSSLAEFEKADRRALLLLCRQIRTMRSQAQKKKEAARQQARDEKIQRFKGSENHVRRSEID